MPHRTSVVQFEDNEFSVDAALIGQGFGMPPSAVQAHMREGKLTAVCERGIGEDEGRYRLTFFFGNRRFRLVVDENGNAIQRSTVDFGSREIPRPKRRF
ncbi:MAG TPA: DUF6522 family protein [Xanthobacteraceae bacterium]|jgi:hypothetical protein